MQERLYTLTDANKNLDHLGPYRSEDRLVEDLRELDQAADRSLSTVRVHVYQPNATDLNLGRRYLGCLPASTVVMMGAVDEGRLSQNKGGRSGS